MIPRAWAAASASATGIAIRSISLSRMPVPRDQGVEALAAHVLHHEKVDAVGRLDLVNRDDVRDGSAPRPLWLPGRTAGDGDWVRHAIVREDLDGDLAAQSRVARAIDLTHPPGAEEREDFIWAKLSTGRQRHQRSTLSSIQMLPVASTMGSVIRLRDTDGSA